MYLGVHLCSHFSIVNVGKAVHQTSRLEAFGASCEQNKCVGRNTTLMHVSDGTSGLTCDGPHREKRHWHISDAASYYV
jgi:hypothetical protein